MKKLIVGIMCLMLLGCGKITIKDNPCDRPEAAGSVICEKLSDAGISVYDADLLFKLANVELIKHNAYTKAAALKFIDNVESVLDTDTYSELVEYLVYEAGKLNSEYGIEIAIMLSYFNRFEGIKISINDYDKYLIREHLKNQRQILGVF